MIGPRVVESQACDQDFQHIKGEGNKINLSDCMFDKPMDQQELYSTVFWKQALVDPHAINLEGCSQPYYILKIVHKESFQHWGRELREINDKEGNKELAWSFINRVWV